MYNVLVDETPLKNAILHTELKYLDLAPSNQDLVGAEVELVSAIGREVRLKEAIASSQRPLRLHPHRLPAGPGAP